MPDIVNVPCCFLVFVVLLSMVLDFILVGSSELFGISETLRKPFNQVSLGWVQNRLRLKLTSRHYSENTHEDPTNAQRTLRSFHPDWCKHELP